MDLAAVEFRQLRKCPAAIVVPVAQDGKRDEHLIGMQTRIVAVEIHHLRLLDRLYQVRGYQLKAMVDTCKMLGRVQEQRCAWSEQRTALGSNDGTILQFDRRCSLPGRFLPLTGSYGNLPEVSGYLQLLHQQGYLVHLRIIAPALGQFLKGVVIAAYYLVLCLLAANLVIAYAVTHHIDTHVRRRLVRVLAVNAFEDGIEDREYLDVPVVVDGLDAIGVEVERIYHVDIVQVRSCGLVGDVNRMLERQVPHRESLELRISSLYPPLALLVQLAEAYGHLAAAGTRSCHNHERTGGLNVIVFSETFVGINKRHVFRISLDGVMIIGGNPQTLESLAVCGRAFLTTIMGDNHGIDQQPPADELVT